MFNKCMPHHYYNTIDVPECKIRAAVEFSSATVERGFQSIKCAATKK